MITIIITSIFSITHKIKRHSRKNKLNLLVFLGILAWLQLSLSACIVNHSFNYYSTFCMHSRSFKKRKLLTLSLRILSLFSLLGLVSFFFVFVPPSFVVWFFLLFLALPFCAHLVLLQVFLLLKFKFSSWSKFPFFWDFLLSCIVVWVLAVFF